MSFSSIGGYSPWWAGAGGLALVLFATSRLRSGPGVYTDKVRGPPRESWLIGQTKAFKGMLDISAVLEEWANEYGGVYLRPGPLGSGDLIVTDPKAVAHVFKNTELIYHIHRLPKATTVNIVGEGLIGADGADHKRQRKSIAPGFTTTKIREYSAIFYDCAHKLEAVLSTHVDQAPDGSCVVDVQHWLNAFALDTIGWAGFSHDFCSLAGEQSPVAAAFAQLAAAKMGLLDGLIFVLQPSIPFACKLPSARQRALRNLNAATDRLAEEFFQRTRGLKPEKEERSIMGLLIKAEESSQGATLSKSELKSQIITLIVAGYETTSTILSWILIELCRIPSYQDRLREELLAAFPTSDPSFEDLVNGLPLLDAVVHETLRLHLPLAEAWRTAMLDDVLPLSAPITLADGTQTTQLVIAQGTDVSVNSELMNRSRAIWGDDAGMFRPERWIEGLPVRAQEISGYKHIMTFLDGPKGCLGRAFAVTNIKVLLVVILRKFAFELPEGPATQFEQILTAVARVRTKGQEGSKVLMRVRRID